MKKSAGIVLAAATLMLVALPALGHVTVQVDDAEPEAFAVYTVRVPNESDTGATTRVEVRIPEGIQASRYQPKPGWTMSIADGLLTIEGGAIGPGQFEEFRFQARNPDASGPISFAAIQTYDDGEVVNWTGEPGSDSPASVVEIGAGGGDGSGGDGPLSITALIVGTLGLAAGAVALLRAR